MEVNLRELKIKDAECMLEWMHSADVTKFLETDFATKSIDDCILFIKSSINNTKDIHFAIVNNSDDYLGTASLKNIRNQTAEFAIVLRASAFGLGIGKKAMNLILNFGRKELKLKDIYWCVSPFNKRAVSFYNKNGYKRIDTSRVLLLKTNYSKRQIDEYLWYKY